MSWRTGMALSKTNRRRWIAIHSLKNTLNLSNSRASIFIEYCRSTVNLLIVHVVVVLPKVPIISSLCSGVASPPIRIYTRRGMCRHSPRLYFVHRIRQLQPKHILMCNVYSYSTSICHDCAQDSKLPKRAPAAVLLPPAQPLHVTQRAIHCVECRIW